MSGARPMECVGAVVVISLIILLIVLGKRASKGSQNNVAVSYRPPPFAVDVECTERDFDGERLRVLDVKMTGSLQVPAANYPVRYVLFAMDVTDGESEPKPVLCMIDELQAPESTILFWASDVTMVPYADSVIQSWIRVLSIPADALVFPGRGSRRLKFSLSVMSAIEDRTMASVECHVDHHSDAKGYLDFEEDWNKVGELAVRLAMAVSAADGSMTLDEAKPMREWADKRVSRLNETERREPRHRLSQAANKAIRDIKAKNMDIEAVCAELVKVSSVAERYDVLELCLNVTRADGTAAYSELQHVHSLAKKLCVDATRFRTMVDKVLPIAMHQKRDPMLTLGIDSSMTPDEMRRHLRREYKKWSGRVTHADPAIRAQAEEMLDLIGKTRSELDK